MSTNNEFRITIIVPCFGRPARTRRMLNNILSQNINGWEAFVIGDGCEQFNSLFESGEADFYQKLAENNNNKLNIFNLEKNYGSHGYHILNYGVKNASGKYLIFAGNDDLIKENHFENYLSEIENTEFDLVYYKTYVESYGLERDPQLSLYHIGHSEIIVRSDFVRDIEHTEQYFHDWYFIENILNKGGKSKKASSNIISYIVKGTADKPTKDNID